MPLTSFETAACKPSSICRPERVRCMPANGWMRELFNYYRRELPQVSFLSRHELLLRQKYACRDKTFDATNIILSRQAYFCRDKTRLLSRQYACLSQQIFVATDVLSWQKIFCLSRQKFCRSRHTFVATKMILAAAPASDIWSPMSTEDVIVTLPPALTHLMNFRYYIYIR